MPSLWFNRFREVMPGTGMTLRHTFNLISVFSFEPFELIAFHGSQRLLRLIDLVKTSCDFGSRFWQHQLRVVGCPFLTHPFQKLAHGIVHRDNNTLGIGDVVPRHKDKQKKRDTRHGLPDVHFEYSNDCDVLY